MTKQHISYSELKIFTECPYKWHLQYEKGLAGFTGNIYTAFGTAIHSVCEQSALGNLTEDEYPDHFDWAFLEELKKLDNWVRRNAIGRFGPVREVKKSLVVEVAFDAVHPSSRHKSGVAMRFPRIHRIRWDKPAEQADTLASVKSLIET